MGIGFTLGVRRSGFRADVLCGKPQPSSAATYRGQIVRFPESTGACPDVQVGKRMKLEVSKLRFRSEQVSFSIRKHSSPLPILKMYAGAFTVSDQE